MNLRKYASEFIGTFFLIATVIGSGIMGENLSQGNVAIALLGNTLATGAILFVIIKSFEDISGAHFNPIVSLVFYLLGEIKFKEFFYYSIIQCSAGLFAVLSIHYMFSLDFLQISSNSREGLNMLYSEFIAALGLIMTILFVKQSDKKNVAIAVALFITAGYWFTSSTSFANPAVTLARTFTDTFTGISPDSLIYFFFGQVLGAFAGLIIFKLLK